MNALHVPLREILWTPLWTLQILTKCKSFRHNPVIGSRVLNRLGLHVLRLCLAHAMSRLRVLQLGFLVDAADRRAYLDKGFLIKPDFLPPDTFERLVGEVRQYDGQARGYLEGNTYTHFVLLDEPALESLPTCRALLRMKRFRRLHRFCGATNRRGIFFIQKVLNRAEAGEEDPQKTLHADTFHPSMKSWLFLEDVDDRKGPFTYVPGSHRLTWKRIKWEYRRSLVARGLKDGHSEDGSFRFGPDDLKTLGLPQPVSCAVPRNTLVIANTFGLHCRGAAAPGTTRTEIWCYSRINPFNPLAGFDTASMARLRHKVYQAYWRYQDRRAKAAGRRSFEHLVEAPIGTDLGGGAQEPEGRREGDAGRSSR